MSARRVLRWEVPVDDAWHRIGEGPVVFVECRHQPGQVAGRVEVWTQEVTPDQWPSHDIANHREVRCFGTGQPLDDEAATHLGSALDADGALVWHLYAKPEPF